MESGLNASAFDPIEARSEMLIRATPRGSRGVVPASKRDGRSVSRREIGIRSGAGVGERLAEPAVPERPCRIALTRRVQYQPGDLLRIRMVPEGSRSSASESGANSLGSTG